MTRAVIDEWSLSAFGLQDASRSLASACKVMRIERQANVEKRSHVFLPPNSRLAYFWASDGTYYSGTVLSLNLRAKVLQAPATVRASQGGCRLNLDHRGDSKLSYSGCKGLDDMDVLQRAHLRGLCQAGDLNRPR